MRLQLHHKHTVVFRCFSGNGDDNDDDDDNDEEADDKKYEDGVMTAVKKLINPLTPDTRNKPLLNL